MSTELGRVEAEQAAVGRDEREFARRVRDRLAGQRGASHVCQTTACSSRSTAETVEPASPGFCRTWTIVSPRITGGWTNTYPASVTFLGTMRSSLST